MNTFEENTIALDKIIKKSIKNINFKETISLIFHAAQKLSNDSSFFENQKWKNLYEEFSSELDEQNHRKWPKLIIVKNDYNKRIDIFSTGTSYIESNNFFTLLFRLLLLENYKRTYIYKSYKYHNILGHKLSDQPDKIVQKIKLDELFDILKKQLKYYLKIYNDADHFENNLASKIMEYFE